MNGYSTPILSCISRFPAFLTLLALLLVTPALAQRGGSQDPVQRATDMKRNGDFASNVALELQNTFRQRPDEIATTLKGVGYKAEETASALRRELRLGGREATTSMLSAGYEAQATIGALMQGQQVPMEDVAAGFSGAGVSKLDALKVFLRHARQTRSTRPVLILGVLQDLGYSYTAAEKAQQMKDLGYAADETAEALDEDGHSGEEIIEALLVVGYETVDTLSAAIENALAESIPIIIGFLARMVSLDDIIQALHDLDYTPQESAGFLLASEYEAGEVAPGLGSSYNLTYTQNAQALNQAGFPHSDIAGALKDPLNADAAQVWDALTGIGIPTGPSKISLLKDAGYTALDVGQQLYDEGITPQVAAQWLSSAQYNYAQVLQVLVDVFKLNNAAADAIINNI